MSLTWVGGLNAVQTLPQQTVALKWREELTLIVWYSESEGSFHYLMLLQVRSEINENYIKSYRSCLSLEKAVET